MDAVLTPRAMEKRQWFPPNNNQMRMKKKNGGGNLISNNNNSENRSTYAGLLNPPHPHPHPPISRAMSFSSASSLFNHHYVQQQQPPLLPVPHVSQSRQTRYMSLTPKKWKPTKREEAKRRSGTQTQSVIIAASDNRSGPDPKHLPQVVLGVGNIHDVGSGSLFNLAPPPSSLPLPKFSLTSKLSCNAQAAASGGVDDGATNNLRRLLRIR